MKTLDGGGKRASSSRDFGNTANPVKDFVNRRIKKIPSSISVESAANSSVCEPTLSTEQTRLSLNEECSLDSSDEYRSYRSLRSTQSGSAPSWPRTSLTSSVETGFDGYLHDANSESNELMVEWTSDPQEDRGRGRSKRTIRSELIEGWPSTGDARQPPRPRRIQSIECDDREDGTVEDLANHNEIPPSFERSQKDTEARGRRRTDDSDNGLNDSFNSLNSITGR